MAENNQGIDEQIIEEVKKLIMFDNDLTYAERNSLGIFYSKIEKGKTVKEAIGPMMTTFQMISSGTSQNELSPKVQHLFSFLLTTYDVPRKTKSNIYTSQGGRVYKLSNKELLSIFLIVIIAFSLYLFLNYILHK